MLARRAASGGLLASCCLLLLKPAPAAAQAPAPAAGSVAAGQAQGEELILTVRVNGVAFGEFTLLRQPGGEFWLRAEDLPRLKLEPVPGARRSLGTEAYYSVQALGAVAVEYDEPQLALALRFPAAQLAGTTINLAAPNATIVTSDQRPSLILSYRLAATQPGRGLATQVHLDTDINVRVAGLLLRQAGRLAAGGDYPGYTRGTSQVIWDDRANARRFTAGDVLSSAGRYGVTITGAGLMITKLYEMTPDVIKQPTATLRAATPLPAEVEVSVDGSPIYRGSVGPGPITLENLNQYGGRRNVRVTVTDASGRREVIEQPFLFTDVALAKGLQEYNYFVGRRSELGQDLGWDYKEAAWQGFHRYGLTDSLTVGAGGEGNADFSTLGGGVTLRSDSLGLVSLDLLANRDHTVGHTAAGWAARYSYLTPHWSVVLGRRDFGSGFRSFLTSTSNPFVRWENQVGFAAQLGLAATLAGDWVQTEDALGRRETGSLRVETSINRKTMVSGQLQQTRNTDGSRDWSAFVYLRLDLDGDRWVGTTVRGTRGSQGIDLETGKNLPQGEGVGYRIGTSVDHRGGDSAGSAFASARWNLRPVSFEFLGTSSLEGGGSQYAEVAASGALVAIDGAWGVTRQVNDSFALARLGVPQAGVQVLLNNQVQGVTDDRGMLFIPDLGAFGRQDVSINDRQLGMQYTIDARRRTVAPDYRSGMVVDFGGKKMSAVAGVAWQVAGGQRIPIASRAWRITGPAGTLRVETSSAGEFYFEDAQPGTYSGRLAIGERVYACRLTVPSFPEAVLELKEGIVCE